MRIEHIKLNDLDKKRIQIGFVGEKNHVQVIIECGEFFTEYPQALAYMTMMPPVGDLYPVNLTRSGSDLIWNVAESDIVNAGDGVMQLTFTETRGNVEEIIKTVYGSYNVHESLEATGDAPDPIATWLAEASEALEEFGKINDLSASAETLPAGSAATAEITDVEGHKNIAIGVPRGADGQDGYSPSASVSKAGKKATITITDKDGTTTAEVNDGADGQDGQDGFSPLASVSKSGKTATISITDKSGTTTAQVSDGTDGQDGQDGFSPSASVSKSGGKATISITDKNGTTTAEVDDGQDGATGATPVISIGTVETLTPGSPATASMDTTDPEHPVLSMGIPEGEPGDATIDDTSTAANRVWSAKKTSELKSAFDVYKNKTTGKSIFNSASLGSSSSVGSHWNFYHDVNIPSGTPIKFTVDSYSGSHFSGARIIAYKTSDSYDVLSPVVSAIGVPQKYTTTSAYIKIQVDIVRTETENNVSCAYSVEIYTGENILTSVYNNTNNIETNADDIAGIEKACDNIEANIDYIDPVIITTADFSNGMYYTDSTWKTNGNFGKCLSNETLFKVCDFTVKAETETFTNILLTIKCFNSSSEFVGNYIAQSADIQSGSYSVKEASIKALYSNTSYISLTFSKISGTTYYDMPSDFEIEVLDDAPTLAERVKVLEDNSSTIGTVVIVAKDGGGMYTSVTDAVNGILDDSASKRYTILIKPGVYDEHIHVGGNRYLSFVGENRETCIMRSHTGMYTDAPIWIDGNFTIENLTFQMLDDEAPESWTPGMSIDDPATMLPGYALHIDGSSNTQVDPVYGYKLGVVRNCTLYSVAYPAIGCGLHSNQMLLFDNCKFIRHTSAKYNYNEPAVGAMLVHESLTAGSVNQNLEIKDCVFICNLSKAASFRFNHGYSSTLKYALINNTFWCEETGSSVVNAELDEAVLLGYSHGNNNSTFNA